MNGESREEEASLYVLRLLEPEEAAKFESAMAGDPELAELVSRLEAAAAALAWTVPPRDPPAALRARIMSQVKRERYQPAPRKVVTVFPGMSSWLPWAAAACLAITTAKFAYDRYHLYLLVDSFMIRDRAQQAELDRTQSREIALGRRLNEALALAAGSGKEKAGLQAQLDELRGEVAELKARDAFANIKIATLASMLKEAPRAMAVVAWDGTAQRGILKPLNIPPAGANQDYQLWIIDPGYAQPVSAGVFDPAQRANFQPLRPISKATQFAISLEKKGGSAAPQGPIVLAGE